MTPLGAEDGYGGARAPSAWQSHPSFLASGRPAAGLGAFQTPTPSLGARRSPHPLVHFPCSPPFCSVLRVLPLGCLLTPLPAPDSTYFPPAPDLPGSGQQRPRGMLGGAQRPGLRCPGRTAAATCTSHPTPPTHPPGLTALTPPPSHLDHGIGRRLLRFRAAGTGWWDGLSKTPTEAQGPSWAPEQWDTTGSGSEACLQACHLLVRLIIAVIPQRL